MSETSKPYGTITPQPGDILVCYVHVEDGGHTVEGVSFDSRDIPIVTDPLVHDFHRAGIFLPDEIERYSVATRTHDGRGIDE